MKILYFHQYFRTRKGSGGTRSYEFAKYLTSKGHQVTVVYALSDKTSSILEGEYKKGLKRGIYEGINLIEFDLFYSNKMSFLKRSFIFLKYSMKSIRLAFKEDYDILFATSTPLTAGIPGIVMKLFRKKKFVFEVRDLWPELPKEMGVIKNKGILALMSMLEWLSYRMADACVGLSPGIVKGIQKRRKRNGRIEMIPNASDTDLFFPQKESKTIIPGCSESDFVAIFTGAHGIANGLNSVIEVAGKVEKSGMDQIKFVFIGDGMQKPSLIEKVKELELNNCIFLEPVSKEYLRRYLNASDIGLMILANIPAFYYGTSPNKFFDYLAAGLPILVNYPGWMSEIIKKNQCGVSVEPENPEKFASVLIELSTNNDLLKEMGSKARKVAEKEFSRSNICSKFEKFLISI